MVIRKVYAACFTGQFAWLGSSLGVYATARRMRAAGIVADSFGYTQVNPAVARIDQFANLGFFILLLGYSLGVSSITYLQSPGAGTLRRQVDLLLAIAGSKLGANYPIDHKWCKRAVLFTGEGMLSSWESPTFDEIVRTSRTPHLLMDFNPEIVAGCAHEWTNLQMG